MSQSYGTLESWQTGALGPLPSQVLLEACVSLSGWCLKEGGLLPKLHGVGGIGVGVFHPPRPPTKRRKKGNLDKKSDRHHAWRSRYHPIYLPAHSRFFPLISPLQMPGTKALQTYTYCQAHGPTWGCQERWPLNLKEKLGSSPSSICKGKTQMAHSESWQQGWSVQEWMSNRAGGGSP